jgi:hypothetical protein
MWLDRLHVLSLRVAWTPQMGLLLHNHFVQNFGDMGVSYCDDYYCFFFFTFNYDAISISVYTVPNSTVCNNTSECRRQRS